MKRMLSGAVGVFALVIMGAFAFAPSIAGLDAPRMLYVHVPMAWASYVGWIVLSGAGVLHLTRPSVQRGATCVAAAEATAVFAAGALVTGLVWARVAFVAYDPLRDPKLITTAVMFLSSAGLVLLAHTAKTSSRERLVAAFAVLGAVTVPASFLASRISVHPDPTSGFTIVGVDVWLWMGASTAAMALVLVAAVRDRVREIGELHDGSQSAMNPRDQ